MRIRHLRRFSVDCTSDSAPCPPAPWQLQTEFSAVRELFLRGWGPHRPGRGARSTTGATGRGISTGAPSLARFDRIRLRRRALLRAKGPSHHRTVSPSIHLDSTSLDRQRRDYWRQNGPHRYCLHPQARRPDLSPRCRCSERSHLLDGRFRWSLYAASGPFLDGGSSVRTGTSPSRDPLKRLPAAHRF